MSEPAPRCPKGKAGCNKVTGKRAVEVLAWLAKGLGYTIKRKPQRRIKPAKT